MKYFYVLISAFVLSLLVAVPSAWAKGQGPNVYLSRGESKIGNYYAAGNSVEVAGAVESDLIVAGGSVVVSGAVGGDVIVAGGNVRISGPVGGNIRVIGGNVEILGTVARNVTAAAGSLVVGESAVVTGHLTVGVGSLELRGKIAGSVLAASGAVVLAGEVQGPVTVYLDKEGSLDIRETAITNGSFDYYGLSPAQISAGAQLKETPQQHELVYKSSKQGWWWRYLISLFSALVLGMVIVSLAPRKVQEVVEEALAKPWGSLGWGALWAILVPIVVIFLFVTLIGWPLALALAAIYVFGLMLALVLPGVALGWYLRLQPGQKGLAAKPLIVVALLGIFIYHLLIFIPIIGGLIALVGVLWGWGALLRVQRRMLQSFR